MKDLPEQQVAQASAMNNMARRLVSSLGVVALSVYYDMSLRASLELGIAYSDASASALHVAFLSWRVSRWHVSLWRGCWGAQVPR
nr:hypothetical protein DK37_05995 [Halomonas sp. SUBG004]